MVQTPLSKTAPREHMRRLFEAVAEPVLPDQPAFILQKPAALRCTRPAVDQANLERRTKLSPREIAQRNYLRKHLMEAVVIIVCHEHPTDQRTQHYDIMEMASEGVAIAREQNPKVVRSLFQGTTLDGIASFFDDDVVMLTSLLYTKKYIKEEDDGRLDVVSGKVRDRNYLPLALRRAKKSPWIVPLAVIYEGRILTVKEADALVSAMKNPLYVRAETVALLNSQMVETGRLLNEHSIALTSSLQSREDQLKGGEGTTPKEN